MVTHELGCTVGAWNAIVRRARIGRERKAAAFVVSSYARADGTRIHCGVARLSVDLEVSYSTARRYLAWLREVGLIELVRAGSRRRGLSDEYRLVLGPDVLERIEVLAPDEYKALSEGVRETEREGSRRRGKTFKEKNQRSSMVSVDEAAPDDGETPVQRSPGRALKNGINAQMACDQRSPMNEPPSPLRISPYRSISPNTTDDGDLLMTSHPSRATEPEEEPSVVVEIFPGASKRPPVGGRRWSDAAMEAVAEASARRAAAVASHQAHLASGETT